MSVTRFPIPDSRQWLPPISTCFAHPRSADPQDVELGTHARLAVLRWVEQITGQRLQITEGALYPALHRMEQKGWLGADWGYTERNREAKFYRLTAAGRRQLTAELSKWSRYTEAVNLVITAEAAR
jgi:hypothetical protein